MKFYAEPNLLVRINKNIPRNRRMKHFRFDSNGEFETDNPRLIKVLSKRFRHEEKQIFKCKKCNYETENKGELLAHYRLHKKGE